jgi:hypothetical protein
MRGKEAEGVDRASNEDKSWEDSCQSRRGTLRQNISRNLICGQMPWPSNLRCLNLGDGNIYGSAICY